MTDGLIFVLLNQAISMTTTHLTMCLFDSVLQTKCLSDHLTASETPSPSQVSNIRLYVIIFVTPRNQSQLHRNQPGMWRGGGGKGFNFSLKLSFYILHAITVVIFCVNEVQRYECL